MHVCSPPFASRQVFSWCPGKAFQPCLGSSASHALSRASCLVYRRRASGVYRFSVEYPCHLLGNSSFSLLFLCPPAGSHGQSASCSSPPNASSPSNTLVLDLCWALRSARALRDSPALASSPVDAEQQLARAAPLRAPCRRQRVQAADARKQSCSLGCVTRGGRSPQSMVLLAIWPWHGPTGPCVSQRELGRGSLCNWRRSVLSQVNRGTAWVPLPAALPVCAG